MYKQLTYDEIVEIKSGFLNNLRNIYTKRGYTFLKEFVRKIKKDECEEISIVESANIVFRIWFWDKLILIDERENVKLELGDEEINKLHNLLKKKVSNVWKESISKSYLTKFEETNMMEYFGKHFLVYDIETVWDISNLDNTKFMLAYSIDSKDFEMGSAPKYKYIDQEKVDKFVDFLLNYDWLIVWYNNVWFDNVVIVKNSSFEDKEKIIETINKKSLDLFLVLQRLLWRRLWLNMVATDIIWVSKTLSGWGEWMNLLKEYEATGDKAVLAKVKNYCRNDVKMTLLVLLYLMFNGKINYEWKDYEVSQESLLNFSYEKNKTDNKYQNQQLLDFV